MRFQNGGWNGLLTLWASFLVVGQVGTNGAVQSVRVCNEVHLFAAGVCQQDGQEITDVTQDKRPGVALYALGYCLQLIGILAHVCFVGYLAFAFGQVQEVVQEAKVVGGKVRSAHRVRAVLHKGSDVAFPQSSIIRQLGRLTAFAGSFQPQINPAINVQFLSRVFHRQASGRSRESHTRHQIGTCCKTDSDWSETHDESFCVIRVCNE